MARREAISRGFSLGVRPIMRRTWPTLAVNMAKISYLVAIHEVALELLEVGDNDITDKALFGTEGRPCSSINDLHYDCIVVASHLRRVMVYRGFPCHKVAKKDIKVAFKWLVDLFGN